MAAGNPGRQGRAPGLVLPDGRAGRRGAAPRIVAAENFYGDVARQIAGPGATVTSVLSNPDQDPYLFAANPTVGRAVAGARIVVSNGAGDGPWMARLVGATPGGGPTIIVANLIHWKQGETPNLWYAPATMPAVARALGRAQEGKDAGIGAGGGRAR